MVRCTSVDAEAHVHHWKQVWDLAHSCKVVVPHKMVQDLQIAILEDSSIRITSGTEYEHKYMTHCWVPKEFLHDAVEQCGELRNEHNFSITPHLDGCLDKLKVMVGDSYCHLLHDITLFHNMQFAWTNCNINCTNIVLS